jgi:hypothetical protein
VTTYRGGAECVGAGSVILWTARQCQWVQEVRDVEVNAAEVAEEMEKTEVAQEAQEQVVQVVQVAVQEEAAETEAEVEGEKKRSGTLRWGRQHDNVPKRA